MVIPTKFAFIETGWSYQCQGIEDVDEHGKDLSVEVRWQEGAEGAEEDDDRHAHGQELPGLGFGSRLCHELAPEEPCRKEM